MMIDLAKAKAELESALNDGRVLMLGEPNKAAAAPEFVRRLSDLRPTLRRLALARACALPWHKRPDEMPACFRWELDRANAEASEEYQADPALIVAVDDLFHAESAPISEVFLKQIAMMSYVDRYSSLVLVLSASDLHAVWLRRERDYAALLAREHYHRCKNRNGKRGGDG